MDEENRDENKIEVFKPGTVGIQGRHALLSSSATLEMEEAPDFLAYWRVIRKRRWTILTIFFVVFTVGLAWTLRQKPIYHAKALVEIEKENPSLVSPQELFQLEAVSDAYLETQYKILKSEALAERVIDHLGLDQLAEFSPQKRWWSWTKRNTNPAPQTFTVGQGVPERDPALYETALERFQDQLEVKPVRRSRAVEIGFDSQDPKLAASIVNTLASNYIEKHLEARWEATQKASEWLSQQLLDLKAKLEKSEDALQKYARENSLLYLETEKGNTESVVNQSLRELQVELTKAQAARYEKESLYRLVQAGDYGSLPGVFENKLLQDLSVRLAELEREHAQLLTTFNEGYPKVRQIQNQINEIQTALQRERERAARRIVNDHVAGVRRESLVRRAFEEKQEQVNLIAEKAVQYRILKREVETNKNMYEGLLQRLKEAGVSAGLKASNIRIVDPAKPPYKPVAPRVPLNLTLAAMLGLGLSVCAAFLQEHMDQTLKNAEDVEHFLRVPALAFIPSVESLNGHRVKVLARPERGVTLTSGKDAPSTALASQFPRIDLGGQKDWALSEAFCSLRTSVLLSRAGPPPRSILVTSAQPREGKTTVATNLAISLAQLGGRVLLIDADMRRPTIHKFFLRKSSQLGSYLAGQGAWQEMVHHTGLGGLDVLLCGPVPPNPAELLSSERMRTLVRESTTQYSFVIFDSPPLLNVADSRILATMVEATILVVKGGDTPRQLVQRAESYAREVGAKVLGVVLNNLDVHADDYSYYQSYGYDSCGSRDATDGKS